jgi:hypothetical protein
MQIRHRGKRALGPNLGRNARGIFKGRADRSDKLGLGHGIDLV